MSNAPSSHGAPFTAHTCPFNLTGPKGRVLWEITSKCNLRCAHCLYYSTGAAPSEGVGRDRSTEWALALVEEIGASGHVEELWLSGGEPMTRRDLSIIAGAITAAGMKPSLSTNGFRIDVNAAKTLAAAGVEYVHLSLDGASAPTHDLLRGRRGSFAQTLTAIGALTSQGITVGATSVIHPGNLREMGDLVRIALESRVSVLSFYEVAPLGRGAENTEYLHRDDLMASLFESFMALNDEFRDRIHLELFRAGDPASWGPMDACHADRFMTISSEGRMGACPWLMKAPRHPDPVSLDETSFVQAWALVRERTQAFLAVRNASLPWCSECNVSAGCGRGCPAVADHDGSDPLCTSLRR